MNNTEIDNYIKKFNKDVVAALREATPNHKQSDSIDRYLTHEIRTLQKTKRQILSEIHKIKYKNGLDTNHLKMLKELLKITRKKLLTAFNQSVNDYWFKKISRISPHSNENMFPQLNSIFRQNNNNQLPIFEIETRDNVKILNNPYLNINALSVHNGKYILSKHIDKANALAKHFAAINNEKRVSSSESLERERESCPPRGIII